jgi:pyruvate dehydrogenase E2 component (dihydrolipoyllysine-residue acetyltransferase)
LSTYEFRLPDIGEGVVEGEVVRWLVKEGDPLKEDQPMVEIMTDKATVEIPAPRRGRVAKRMFAEGERCPVGKVLIAIDVDGAAEPVQPRLDIPAAPHPAEPQSAAAGNGTGRHAQGVLATPATRKLARDVGVDIRSIDGTGPAGRITTDDVRARAGGNGAPAAAPPLAVSDADAVRVPFRGLRKRIAENLVRWKHVAPHATYVEEVDCTDLVALRARLNRELAASDGGKLSFLPFIIQATIGALKAFPQMNAALDEAAGEIVQWRRYHIGLATATDSGLMVPVIRDADRKSLRELGREIERLASATRNASATREELMGSTFTITSLGAWGGVMATAIINPSEVAILGVHKIARRPAVMGDKIAIRELMNLSLSFDHRLVDGLEAARFVGAIKAALEAASSFDRGKL